MFRDWFQEILLGAVRPVFSVHRYLGNCFDKTTPPTKKSFQSESKWPQC